MELLRIAFKASVRRACKVLKAPQSTFCYKPRRVEQALLRKRIREIAALRVRYGYRRIHVLLRREGRPINHKRVHRLYREEGLQMRLKVPRRRVCAKLREDRAPAPAPNACWSRDFMADQLFDGRKLQLLTIVDNFSRVSPAIEAGQGFKSTDVVQVLDRATAVYGVPERIRVDNGPEFVSKELDLWAYGHGVVLDFSRPGKPTDNAFIEAFNARERQECLNLHWFLDLQDARDKVEAEGGIQPGPPSQLDRKPNSCRGLPIAPNRQGRMRDLGWIFLTQNGPNSREPSRRHLPQGWGGAGKGATCSLAGGCTILHADDPGA